MVQFSCNYSFFRPLSKSNGVKVKGILACQFSDGVAAIIFSIVAAAIDTVWTGDCDQ